VLRKVKCRTAVADFQREGYELGQPAPSGKG
jgi:hypothetical protein